jgi:replicative DNA helicase
VEYLYQHRGEIIGIPTGLADLDKILGGMQRSDVIILAGRPGMGKTSLALSIALHAARRWQKRVAIFSLEMSDEQLVQRLISAETGIDSQRLRLGDIKENEWPTFIQATNLLSNTSVFIDDTPAISALELRTKARRLHAEHGLDLLIIDYLQLMRGDSRSENRQQEISYISRSIKALARELNIPILALSQLSRQVESRHDKHPMLSDLRESGSIEQDADVVMFVYRDDVYNPDTEFPNIAEIIISKHRSGPTGIFSVYFKKHLAQFVDLEVRRQSLEY